MEKKQAKNLLKIAILLYAGAFLIINWNTVSWVFNYKEVGGLFSDFFNPYPSISAASVDATFYPNQNATAAKTIPDVAVAPTDKQDTLEIPKLSLSVPIVFATSTDENSLEQDLDLGTVYYPGSVYPGQAGVITILGHSAPPNWPQIKHDWVFTNLQELAVGDSIMIDLNNKQYTYVVKSTTIVQRGANVPDAQLNGNDNILTLISCWPPGKDYQRIAVQAELQTQ